MIVPRSQACHERIAPLVVALSSAILAVAVMPRVFALDDAYIVLHGARSFLAGHDDIFDAPALVGITSPAYAALVTALVSSGQLADALALKVAAVLGMVAYASAVWWMAAVAGIQHVVARIGFTVVAIGSGFVLVNLTNGLETGWAMAVLVCLIGSAARGRTWAAGLLAGLLVCLRPDLAPAGGLLLIAALWRQPWSVRVVVAGVAVAAVAPFALWMHSSSGAWLPQTMRAKAMFYAEGCQPARVKALMMARGVGLGVVGLLPLSIGLAGLPLNRVGQIGLAAMTISFGAYFTALPDALTYNYGRYFYALAVPWCCWGAASIAARLSPRRVNAVCAGLAIATVAMAIGARVDQDTIGAERTSAAEWVDANVPSHDVVLVHDAGVISEMAHRRAVDLVGLKTESSIAAHANWTWRTCGANRAAALAVIARTAKPSYLLVHTSWERGLHIAEDLTREGFRLQLRYAPASGSSGYVIYSFVGNDTPQQSY